MRRLFFFIAITSSLSIQAQSFEFMPGTEQIFIDVQWLNTFDEEKKWSLFSRTRATTDYDEKTDLFTGAYLNYTTASGIGGTVLGRIGSRGAGGDAGIHFFKAKKSILIYALASLDIDLDFAYSWFSIIRYTPEFNDTWRLYSSLELFSNFNADGHVASVQRIRAGIDRSGYQFGLALNLSEIGNNYDAVGTNPGLFVRKQF
ncbi:MAG: hypothetical protein AB7H80_09635 [Candidatus Kapaibacterium sp.]